MKKQSKWLVGILAALVIALGSFIIYDKLVNKEPGSDPKKEEQPEKNNKKNEESKEQAQEIVVSDPLVQQLYEMISFGTTDVNYNYYFLENKNLTASTVSDEQKHFYAFPYINGVESKGVNESGNGRYRISAFEFDKAINKVFGTTEGITRKGDYFVIDNHADGTFDAPCISYKYNFETNYYDLSTGACGGIYAFGVEKRLIDAHRIGKQIEVREKFLFYQVVDNGTDQFYPATINLCPTKDCAKIIGTVHLSGYEDFENYKFNYDQYQDQMNIITYTFEKNDDGSYHYAKSSTLY